MRVIFSVDGSTTVSTFLDGGLHEMLGVLHMLAVGKV
jgi:hypothetical protein